MARPHNKKDLQEAASTNYEKLSQFIKNMTEEELNTPFDFSQDEKKKEAHWKRDKNVRDVIIHLHEWHKLMLEWIKNMEEGTAKRPFLAEGYSWKTYGDMNRMFWKNSQNVSLNEAMKSFEESHNAVMESIENISEDILFERAPFDWVGTSSIGSYYVSVTSSHYEWALKKLKAHRKNVNGK